MFSIIVPTYNDDKFIKKCIDSILNQDYFDYELIVVVDGSTDNTISILKENYSNNDKISIIYQENAGSGIARNNGISHSKGEYIVFVDSDDWLEDGALSFFQRQIDLYNCDWLISSTRIVETNEKNNMTIDLLNENGVYCEQHEVRSQLVSLYTKGRAFGPVANVYKRSIIERNGIVFPDERRSQDIFFNTQYMKYVQSLAVSADITYNIRYLSKKKIRKDKTSRRNNSVMVNAELARLGTIERLVKSFYSTLEFWEYELSEREKVLLNTRYFIEIHNALFSVWERNKQWINSMVLTIHNSLVLKQIISGNINCFFYYRITRFCIKHKFMMLLKIMFYIKSNLYGLYLLVKRKKHAKQN